jgi:radical SAM-linked protein
MTDPNQLPQYRYRLTFAKKAAVKYIAHLDLALAWERALRRAQIPLAYSKGFNPQPKVQFACSLPLGSMGRAEIVDIITTVPVTPAEALVKIRQALPGGIELQSIEEVPLREPALQALVHQGEYSVLVETGVTAAELKQRIDALLAADEVMLTRRRKKKNETFNLRPWLHQLKLVSIENGEAHLHMRLATGQFGNLRPVDVLRALDLADNWAEIERTRLIFSEI